MLYLKGDRLLNSKTETSTGNTQTFSSTLIAFAKRRFKKLIWSIVAERLQRLSIHLGYLLYLLCTML